MAPMSSNNCSLNPEQQIQLLDLARRSISHGLHHGQAIPVDIENLPPELKEKRATFVTLLKFGELRGCIGMLEAIRPLAEDIANNAYSAAFQDPRFPPLQEHELEQLEIHLTLLTAAEPMEFKSEQDLLSQLRPGVDGLILKEGARRATFLPSVWEQLREPKDFLGHLKRKAGLPAGYWSDSLQFFRYRAELVEE